MPPYRQPPSWRLEGGGQILDLETAVKDGILGGVGGGGGGGLGGGEKVDLKQMIEELEPVEDVPTVFICPISLEPMVDPVTLCTGQTYERSNILKWLSMGHFTCPTTMQELWEDAVTPNHTLHQLIHAWFSQRYLRFKKRSLPPPPLPPSSSFPSSVTPSSTPTFPSFATRPPPSPGPSWFPPCPSSTAPPHPPSWFPPHPPPPLPSPPPVAPCHAPLPPPPLRPLPPSPPSCATNPPPLATSQPPSLLGADA